MHTHAHTHRGTRTHKHSDYTKLNLHSLKWAANGDLIKMDEDSGTEHKNMAGLQFWENTFFKVSLPYHFFHVLVSFHYRA